MDLLRKIKDKYLVREKYIYTCSLDCHSVRSPSELILADHQALAVMFRVNKVELSLLKYRTLLQRLEIPTEECLLMYSSAGDIMGYCHVAYANHYNAWSNLQVKLDPGQVYFFDDYVFRAFRRKGLHKYSIAQRKLLAAGQGYSSALTIIDKSNSPSHHAYTSQGFQPTRTLWHFPLLKKNVIFGRQS